MNFEQIDFNSQQPLNQQLGWILEKKIRSREIEVGQKLPTQRELRDIFKVCNNTIEEALATLVDEGYIIRRQNRGTVVISSEPKKGLNLKTRNEVVLINCVQEKQEDPLVENQQNLYAYQIIKGIESELQEKGLFLMLRNLNGGSLEFGDKGKNIAGVIITGAIRQEQFAKIKGLGIPFVLTGDISQKDMTSGDYDVIGVDDKQCVYLAAKHLAELGHKGIAILSCSFSRYSWEIEHLNGYKQALEEAGIPFDGLLALETGGGLTMDDGYNAMNAFLNKNIPFTGLVCVDPLLLIGAIRALAEKNKKIKDDISIVQCTASPLVGITTVEHSQEDIGKTAVGLLCEKLEAEEWKPKRVLVQNRLCERYSTRKIEER
jgi:LacI family transcriptional regulator